MFGSLTPLMSFTNQIYHEKQQGNLCAQHALNSLLQGAYFTAIDLSEIARNSDKQEQLLLDSRIDKSSNYDDTGFFSIQVIIDALLVFNLTLSELLNVDVVSQKAFICNLNEHWFTLRRFGTHWYNLNSMNSQPTYISNTYLDIFIAQLKQEGYSIFNVTGDFPRIEMDEMSELYTHSNTANVDQDEECDDQVKKAIKASLEDDDEALKQVMKQSLDEYRDEKTIDELRAARLSRFG